MDAACSDATYLGVCEADKPSPEPSELPQSSVTSAAYSMAGETALGGGGIAAPVRILNRASSRPSLPASVAHTSTYASESEEPSLRMDTSSSSTGLPADGDTGWLPRMDVSRLAIMLVRLDVKLFFLACGGVPFTPKLASEAAPCKLIVGTVLLEGDAGGGGRTGVEAAEGNVEGSFVCWLASRTTALATNGLTGELGSETIVSA